MKKIIVTIVFIIGLAGAAYIVASLLAEDQPGSGNTQSQQSDSTTEKPNPGVIEEETGPKSPSGKSQNLDESNLTPEQQRRKDAKEDQ